ncbi:sensor histidine kinase [Almyronema epifaneia]|uniref:histidine kinase n=1 Tax=Almyronema epifaneia S1 TaxID=2991925 RepID=A0ABW6ICE5_9CYAN
MTVRNRIICGYSLVIGLALTGSIVGLAVGNHYQKQALEVSRQAKAKRELLSDLQVAILYNRPVKQLSPYLDDSERFRLESQNLLVRVAEIQQLLQRREHLGVTAQPQRGQQSAKGLLRTGVSGSSASVTSVTNPEQPTELDRLLDQYAVTVEKFRDRTEAFIQNIDRLSQTPESAEAKQNLLVDFVQSPEFVDFIEFPEQLLPFVALAKTRDISATAALEQAETIRNSIILGSLLLSAAIASVIAVLTSRAIAGPIQAVTKIARQVTYENNFDLQIPIQYKDEVGDLAKSFNQLIQQVNHLFVQLNQRNDKLAEALEQLSRQQAHLVQSEKMSSLGQLVAGLAHEINNPVNFIHGNITHIQSYTQDLLELVDRYQQSYPLSASAMSDDIEDTELDFIREDLPKLIGSMKLGTERIREIVLSLRNFARMDEAAFKAVNIHEGLDSTLMILGSRLKANAHRPEIQVVKNYENLPLVECYPGQMNQVFMNLLANAIDALEEIGQKQKANTTPEPQPLTITISTSTLDNQWVEIAIADNGPGIPETLQQKIFNPFFTTKSVGKGIGMGLAISYQIVNERHSGQLLCHSADGAGTTFAIRISTQQAQPPQSTSEVSCRKVQPHTQDSPALPLRVDAVEVAEYVLASEDGFKHLR